MNNKTIQKLKEKFTMHICYQQSCWLWTGPLDKNNHPTIRYIDDHSLFKEIHAKRLSLLINGDRLESPRIHVENECKNKLCVNPAHLVQANDNYRFWKRVNKSDNSDVCWEWQASKNKYGYGKFTINGKSTTAHRYSYLIHIGPIPVGKLIRHDCDNPACVNPMHLHIGTHLDNAFDRKDRNRSKPRKGTNHPFSKLNEKDIEAIKSMYATRKFSQKELGYLFGVSGSCISRILKGDTYND